MQALILHPNYEARIRIAELFDDLKPKAVVTGRHCTGSKSVISKITGKVESKPKYSTTRKFVIFEDDSRMSISNAIFSHLKIDHKLSHSFENYYA